MSDYQDVDRYAFLLDGRERLGAEHDRFADVLYLWRSGGPGRPAISVTSSEGYLVRIDPENGELIGFTIFGWEGELKCQGPIQVTVPSIAHGDDDEPRPLEPQTHNLELVPA